MACTEMYYTVPRMGFYAFYVPKFPRNRFYPVLPTIMEESEPPSPCPETHVKKNAFDQYLEEAIHELQRLIERTELYETNTLRASESIIQFANDWALWLEDTIEYSIDLATSTSQVDRWLIQETRKLIIRIKTLGRILSLRVDESLTDAIPVMLRCVLLDLTSLALRESIEDKHAVEVLRMTISHETALEELKEGLFDRYPVIRSSFESIESPYMIETW